MMARVQAIVFFAFIIFAEASTSSNCLAGCDCFEDWKVTCHLPELSSFPSTISSLNVTVLDLANNNIVHLPSGSLNGLENLEELNLASNKIYSVEEELFNNSRRIKKLNAEDNNIHILPRNVFVNLVNLREINLSENHLARFPNFAKNINLEILSLSHNEIASVPEGALKHNTNLREIYLKSLGMNDLVRSVFPNDVSNFTIADFSENRLWATPSVIREMKNLEKLHLSSNPIKTFASQYFRPLSSLNTLEMANVGMKEVPENLFWLPKLAHLDISRNHISGSSLKNIQFPNLLSLKMESNPIGMIAGDAFDEIPKLEILRASSCDISAIKYRAFKKLLNLKILDLRKNSLDSLPNLQDNRYLEEILLDNNNIEVLDLDSLKKMEKLKLLSVANNSLITLGGSLFRGQLTITELNVSGNKLESFPHEETLNELPLLKSLDISGNAITGELALSSISGLEHLQILNMSGNSISRISGYMGDVLLWSLERFYICDNNLTDLNYLARFPNLLEFAADGNSIKTISIEAFYNNSLLKKLSLNQNKLAIIDSFAFSNLAHLEELLLLDNELTECPNLLQNSKLKVLDLSNNPIGNLQKDALLGPEALESLLLRSLEITSLEMDALGNVDDMKILDLARNNLTSIPSPIRHMKSLRTMTLTRNPISAILPESLRGLSNLREVHLDQMRLRSLDITEFFTILPGLRFLWVSGNPWQCDCEIESFALGVDGSRLRVEVVDRSKMTCDGPSIFHGRILETLDVNDFTQCKASKVLRIGEASALVQLPAFSDNILYTVSYMSIPGVEKYIDVAKGKREVLLGRLISDTKYIVCFSTVYINELYPRPGEGQADAKHHDSFTESCIKFKTLKQSLGKPWSKGGFGGSLASSQQILLVYIVLGGCVCLTILTTSLFVTFWYKRRKSLLYGDPTDVEDSESLNGSRIDSHSEVDNAVEIGKVGKRSKPGKNAGNGSVLEMNNEGGCVNLACNESTTPQRTKL